MAAWPELAEVKRRLDVTSSDWDGEASGSDDVTDLSRLLAAAITETMSRIGIAAADQATYEPDDNVAQSALELCVEYALREPDPGRPVTRSKQLLFDSRQRFGTA